MRSVGASLAGVAVKIVTSLHCGLSRQRQRPPPLPSDTLLNLSFQCQHATQDY